MRQARDLITRKIYPSNESTARHRMKMLSLRKQIIYEWECSQGRENTPSRAVEAEDPRVITIALRKCSIEPLPDNLVLLDKLIELVQCKSLYERGD